MRSEATRAEVYRAVQATFYALRRDVQTRLEDLRPAVGATYRRTAARAVVTEVKRGRSVDAGPLTESMRGSLVPRLVAEALELLDRRASA